LWAPCCPQFLQGGFETTSWKLKSFLSASDFPSKKGRLHEDHWFRYFPPNRALLVLSHVQQYIHTIILEPLNKLFDIVKEGCRSVLMPAKLFFFESVVSQFNRFLVCYQTDRPVVPFLCRNLDELLRAICERFVKKTVLDEASTASQLVKQAQALP